MRTRLLFLALLIALLPLRGWVGDVMAMERTSTVLTQMAGHHAMASTADAHADCPGHATALTETQATAMPDDCGTCTACQICHAPALTPESQTGVPLTHRAMRPETPAMNFASAERAPGFKPPIS